MIVEHKGAKLFYNVIGEGKPIILLHGFLENSNMWTDVIPDLARNNQVISIDILGHGKSDCLSYIHTMKDFAEAVLEVVNTLNLDNYQVIGHSLGGYIALALAEMDLDRIEGLCLMNSTPENDNKARILLRNRAIKNAKVHYEALVKMSISNLFFEANRAQYSTQIEALQTEALKTPVQGYISAQEGMKLRPNNIEFFKNLNIKKLIIIGQNDPVLDSERLIEIAKETHSDFKLLKGGHMSQIEALADLKSALLQFIN